MTEVVTLAIAMYSPVMVKDKRAKITTFTKGYLAHRHPTYVVLDSLTGKVEPLVEFTEEEVKTITQNDRGEIVVYLKKKSPTPLYKLSGPQQHRIKQQHRALVMLVKAAEGKVKRYATRAAEHKKHLREVEEALAKLTNQYQLDSSHE